MQAQDIRTTIEKAVHALVQSDAETFSFLFTADGQFIVPGTGWIGCDAIRQAITEFSATASDVSIKISQILITSQLPDGSGLDRAFVEWHWENTEVATGNRYRADDAIAIDFRDGRISRWREYIDSKPTTYKTVQKEN